MYCVKGGATEYIHDWKFICGRMTRSERRAIDQQGETEAGASGDELGAPFFFGPLLSVYTYSHRQLLVAVWPAAIIRPLGAAPLGGGFLASIYQQTPPAACASDAATPIARGLGDFSHQQAARGIYLCIACCCYHGLKMKVECPLR